MTYRRLAEKWLGGCARNIELYARNIREQKDPEESLHQLRINIRRLRNLLWFFKGLFSGKDLDRWNKDLRRMARASSAARDLDAYTAYLEKYQAGLRSDQQKECVGRLVRHLKKRRATLKSQIAGALESGAVRPFEKRFRKALEALSSERRPEPFDKIYTTGRKKIARRTRELLSFEPVVSHPEQVRELHRMRIAAKHLRYTLEGVAEAYDNGIIAFIRVVFLFHRQLGEMHDYDVWLEDIADFLSRQKLSRADCAVLMELERNMRAARETVYLEFKKDWSARRISRFFEDLLEYTLAFEMR